MRLAMIELEGGLRPATVLEDGGLVDLRGAGHRWRDLEDIIRAGPEGLRQAANTARAGARLTSQARLLCPVSRPEKIMCIGKNYADHCRELNSPLPERPVLFAKYPNTLAGPGQEIEMPRLSSMVDFEAELAAVIGTSCKKVSPEEALHCIFGYTCANDLTLRDAQKVDGQWTRAKSPDSFCPLGPWVVTADEIARPQELGIKLTLNGELMQDSSTSQMVFGVAELVSYLSQTMTLRPGDVLLTGTPPGVGAGRDPQVFLSPGDRVAVEIERIGTLENIMR